MHARLVWTETGATQEVIIINAAVVNCKPFVEHIIGRKRHCIRRKHQQDQSTLRFSLPNTAFVLTTNNALILQVNHVNI